MKKVFSRTAIPLDKNELKMLFHGACEDDIKTMERNLRRYLGVKAVLALDSGRSSLFLALQLLKLKKGDKILLPAFVCPVVYDVVLSAKLTPLPVDVSPKDYNIDAACIKKEYLKSAKAIIVVHLFGKSCNLDEIVELAEEYGLYIIEDAAQALGATYKGKKVGCYGDLSILSFGLGKNITGGCGGALVINRGHLLDEFEEMMSDIPYCSVQDRMIVAKNIIIMKMLANPRLYSVLREYVNYYLEKTDRHIIDHIKETLTKTSKNGSSYEPRRIHPLSAKIVDHQLRKIDYLNQKRIDHAKTLLQILSCQSKIYVPQEDYFRNNVFCRFPVKLCKGLSNKRDYIIKKLVRLGVDAEKPYHIMNELAQIIKHAVNAIKLTKTLITIPNHPCLTNNEVASIGEKVLSVLRDI